MKKLCFTATTFILVVCLLFACGCTGPSATPETAVKPAESTFQPVSYEDTPVQYSDVNGVSLAYREFGTENSKPLLMIIGWGGDMDGWDTTFIGLLAEKYHVYIYDHRDMGQSTETDAPLTIPMLADDAEGLIKALGYDSMYIYGMSMGTAVLQQILVDQPEMVQKAVLSSASVNANLPETEKLHGELEEALKDPDTPEGVRKETAAILEWDGVYDSLSGITNDVMFITGTADDVTPQSVAVDMAGQIDGSWLVRFKGIPHAGSSYAPEEYAGIVITFLEMDESPA
ncbi:alpha/beta fold hydrolase [Methanoplanus endosymbiosus]|uniref:Alpha/beta hydrolase n=1 Tax=Methanoplanus endosymbiosus TaxID=33865 RepID=A0A9E7TH03_9EURY|nr:alpha/beta hydrolase [Methanoplanus endosymbiosus]UUX91977.1 alpha/beta hydrolase [Methanoplanus endosymbiosus]